MAVTRRSKSKCRLSARFAKPLRVAILLLAASFANALKAQGDGLFSKSFPDGSKVRLTRSTLTEFRSRPRRVNPDAPEKEIYSDREWKLVTYTLLLKRPTVNEEERLWSSDVEYPVAEEDGFRMRNLAVNDVLLIGDRAYVLIGQGFVSVVNLTRERDGYWVASTPTDLAQSTDVYPIVRWIFTPNAKPQIAIDMIIYDKIRTWTWTLKGERWVWDKKSSWRSAL